eukprot:1080849-Amorphochlora_amoeboformis.AAC.4
MKYLPDRRSGRTQILPARFQLTQYRTKNHISLTNQLWGTNFTSMGLVMRGLGLPGAGSPRLTPRPLFARHTEHRIICRLNG